MKNLFTYVNILMQEENEASETETNLIHENEFNLLTLMLFLLLEFKSVMLLKQNVFHLF